MTSSNPSSFPPVFRHLPLFRPAEQPDLDEVVRLIMDVDRKVGDAIGIPADPRTVAYLAARTIREGVCLIGAGAVAGGFINHYPLNYDAKVGTVYFWNFTKPAGIQILEAIMRAFQELGATHFSCSSHEPDHRIGDWYLKKGLYKAEMQWIMALK